MSKKRNESEQSARQLMYAEIGQFLKNKREEAGLSQKDVAEQAKLSTPQYVSNVERGISPPSNDFLRLLIRLYKLNVNELIEFMTEQQQRYLTQEFMVRKQAR